MLPPLVLRPPHGPRLVRLLVMVLAVIFYLPPAGWSLITNGPEGELAGAALDLLNRQGWTASWDVALLHGPLSLWLTRSSLAFFGVNEFAARLPSALGTVALLWLTLRIGERAGGSLWNGCVAALMLLCSPGLLTLGRLLTPMPLAAALTAACIYGLQRSIQARPERRRWLTLAWIAWGFATLAGGWRVAAIPAGTVALLAAFYPEARLRFAGLVSWQGGLTLAATAAVMIASGFPPWGHSSTPELTSPWPRLILGQMALLFPWCLLLLPAVAHLLGRLLRLHRPSWEEAFPLAWAVSAAGVMLAVPSFFHSLYVWPALALWGAPHLNTLHRKAFLNACAAVGVVAAGGLYLTQHLRTLLPAVFPSKAGTLEAIAPFFWSAVTPVAFLAVLAFVLLTVAAFWAEYFQNRRFALLALFAAMIPAGFALADIGAKFAPSLSDASLCGCIESAGRPPIYLDASRFETSSLLFYLGEEARRQLQPAPPDLAGRWQAPAVLVAPRERISPWKEALQGRFTAGCESGEHLLLMAKP